MEGKMCHVKEGGSWQVIVAGGGPAGCAAAIASAREGKRTLLIEETSALGGMGTMGLVPWWCTDACFCPPEQSVYQGIAGKIIGRCSEYSLKMPTDEFPDPKISPEALKRIYDEEVTAAGAQVLFQTRLCDVDAEDSCIRSVLVANRDGLSCLHADVFVDATGDGDLSVQSGAQAKYGRDGQKLQSATCCFSMTNVDTWGYEYALGQRMNNGNLATMREQPEKIASKLCLDPELDLIGDGHFCNVMIGAGTVGFNAGHIEDVRPLDPFWVSESLMKGRQIAHQFERGLRKYAPEGFGNAWLAQTGALLGIRESRRIVCDYMLTIQDYVKRRSFADEIGRTKYMVDIHRSVKEQEEGGKNPEEVYRACGPKESVGIPYRSLLPKGIKNLLVAGRCIGSDALANGSIRVMPVCLVTGEAAGQAAALAVEQGGNTRKTDLCVLQKKLEEYGACLHAKNEGSDDT